MLQSYRPATRLPTVPTIIFLCVDFSNPKNYVFEKVTLCPDIFRKTKTHTITHELIRGCFWQTHNIGSYITIKLILNIILSYLCSLIRCAFSFRKTQSREDNVRQISFLWSLKRSPFCILYFTTSPIIEHHPARQEAGKVLFILLCGGFDPRLIKTSTMDTRRFSSWMSNWSASYILFHNHYSYYSNN